MSKLMILSDTPQGRNQHKGKLFEKLMTEVLKQYGYQIDSFPSVNYAGMEIDIEGKQILTNVPFYAECKFYGNEIDAPKFQAFFGKYMTRWFKDKKSQGIFIAIPGLNSHAKGLCNESIQTNSEITFKLFEEEQVLKTIFDSKVVVNPDMIAQKIPQEIGRSGDWNVIYSDKGYFFLQYIIKTGDSTPRFIALFDGQGNMLDNADDTEYIVNNIPELKDFEILKLHAPITRVHQTSQVIEEIVEVRGSDGCFEYQFPASPQYYVGREKILEEFNNFIKKVVRGEVASRGVFFEANSGWGKSSTVLKCVESLKNNGHISIAIDSRSASSSRFVLDVVKYVIERKSVIGLMQLTDKTVSGYDGAFKILEKVSDSLKLQNKLLVLFFDQFENIFYQQETLKNICNLFLKVCDKKLNIVFGFSWKSDLIGLTSEFPFQLRDSISSQSQCIPLGIFSEQEINCLLGKLSEEIKSSLRNDLKFFLSEYSQGYPWLLKKLCAHVKAQREKGISQADIAAGALNVEELFKADMIGLSAKEESALRSIAKSAPISVSDIGEEFRLDIVQPLITNRLVVKIGHKYDIYWDIFRDYLNSGKLPEQENYIIRSAIKSVYTVTKALVNNDRQRIEDLQEKTRLSKSTLFNVCKDMELLGVARVENGKLLLNISLKDDTEFDKSLRAYLNDNLKKNRLISKILQQLGNKEILSCSDVALILEESCPYISATKKTWLTYARFFMGWMDVADLALMESGSIRKYAHGTQIREKTNFKIKMRGDGGLSIIQYSPIEEILCRMIGAAKTGERIDWSGLAKSTIFKSLAVLERIGFIVRENTSKTIRLLPDAFTFVENVSERPRLFAEKAQSIDIFKSFVEVLNENAETGCGLNELGVKLREKLNTNWANSTAKTNAKILMDWAKHAQLAPTVYARDRRGRNISDKPASDVIKGVLLNEVIPNMRKNFSYFSYLQINDLLLRKEITVTQATLKSYIFAAVKNNVIFDAGKSWYSAIGKKFFLNREPVEKIIETLKKTLPLLPFSCWSTEQINSFAHHLLSKHVIFVYVAPDYIRSVAETLKNAGYTVYENPRQAEIKKHFEISGKAVMVLPAITKQPESGGNAAPVEKILVDFLIENKKIKLIEEQEALRIVKNAVNSGIVNMASMISYAKRRKLKPLSEINQLQYILKVEVVD